MAVFAERAAEYLDLLKKGQTPPASLSLTQLEEDLVLDGVKYGVRLLKQGVHHYRVVLNGSVLDCVAHSQPDGGILLQVDGQKRVVYSENEAMGIRLSIDSWTCLLANENDPSQVLAPSAGKLRRYLVEDGTHLSPDDPYAELEVMKMLMPLLAPAAGSVHFQLPEGAVLNCGDLIAKLELDDPNAILRAVVSEETFPESLGPPQVYSDRVDDRFALAHQAASEILAGYERDVEETVSELLTCLEDRNLVSLCWMKAFSVVHSRLPNALKEELQSILSRYDSSSFDIIPDVACSEFPVEELLHCMKRHIAGTPLPERPALKATLEPLLTLSQRHLGGHYTRYITQELLEQYLTTEEKFQPNGNDSTEQDIIYALRHEYSGNLQGVLDLVVSRQASQRKSQFIQQLLVHVVLPSPADFRPLLRRLTGISASSTTQILKKAQYLLEQSLLADLKAVVLRCLSGLEMFCASADFRSASLSPPSTPAAGRVARKVTQTEGLYKGLGSWNLSQSGKLQVEMQKMEMLVDAPAAVDDALALLLALPEEPISEDVASSLDQIATLGVEYRILMTYIKRMYHHRIFEEPKIERHKAMLFATWTYGDSLMETGVAHGAMVVLKTLSDLKDALVYLGRRLSIRKAVETVGTCHIALTGACPERFELCPEAEALLGDDAVLEDDSRDLFAQDDRFRESLTQLEAKEASRRIQASIQSVHTELRALNFEAIGVVIPTETLPLRKGYLWSDDEQRFISQVTLRHVEAPVAKALELSRLEYLAPQHAPSRNRQWHIYTVEERLGRNAVLKRLYLRGLVHQIGTTPEYLTAACSGHVVELAKATLREIETTMSGCLEELLRVQHGLDDQGIIPIDWSHIFLSLLPPVALSDDAGVAAALRSVSAEWLTQRMTELRRACVAQIEIKIHVADGQPWRIVLSLPTGHETGEEHIDIYRETISAGEAVYEARSEPLGALNGQAILTSYTPLSALQQKRLTARRHGTTYCHDFPTVFANALSEIWSERAAAGEPASEAPSGALVDAQELGFGAVDVQSSPYDWLLEPIQGDTPRQRVGMVAWEMTLRAPEAPDGRQIVAIANDITYQSGAFGPKEDALFAAAVDYALQRRLPIVYLAANSGARVGLATDIREKLKVEWLKPQDPSKGFAYLYLDDADYHSLVQKGVEGSSGPPIIAERRHDGRWVVTDVIGCEDGLGVECLSGSGAIAGAFAKAFREGITFTLVSSRTVGIGAYLARLGRRCVQAHQPIILTGYQALNKLLGREVYTSQLQLGGPKVMGVNGVSHHVVSDDLAGVKTILKWLSYTPCLLGTPPSPLATSDPAERPIEYTPEGDAKLDPMRAIAGWESDEGWISGLFDKGSWLEAQEGWAQTVVTGRARLGGIPVGIIAVQTQTVFKTIPADPGMMESSEQSIPQAGQVWFPDSALKTAQAMEEFNLEGLPLMILANWRGFSGGQRDLFEGVLQAGSLIVEYLRSYQQPVFVYLPPNCELRGGAWVVIDSKINASMVEMYADPSARGGVLEPEGVVEIKFKKSDLLKMMHRLDPELMRMDQQNVGRSEILKRERELLPVYHQVALQFAEMHDTPQRMQGKGVLHGILPWKTARPFLIQRLRRRRMEEKLINQIRDADARLSRDEAMKLMQRWFERARGEDADWSNDASVETWAMSEAGMAEIETEMKALSTASAQRRVEELLATTEGTDGLFAALQDAIQRDSRFKQLLTQL